ncbi:unnamed protein product [Peniophora sp. CBMAI 1063]|nr:unnamed protein product [Peniophora sp. CBMAI 1063]
MPPGYRRPSGNSLSPYDQQQQQQSSDVPQPFPRATSPSGFGGLLSKPAKWFSRSNNNNATPRPRAPSNTSEPRSSTSSYVRKPKISQPTDPRPILASALSEPYIHAGAGAPAMGKHAHASRSVFDLSLARTQTAAPDVDSAASSPSGRKRPNVPPLGDLRGLSRKPWSRSADDLSKAPPSPASASMQDKVSQYRQAESPISVSRHSPSPSAHSQYLFPVITNATSPPTSPNLSSSPPSSPSHLHARSHSFTPKLPSKLGPVSPVRKMSAGSTHTLQEPVPDMPPLPASQKAFAGRGAFPFTFGAKSPSPSHPNDSPTDLLPPPVIVEPDRRVQGEANKRESVSGTSHSGLVSRLTDYAPASGAGKNWKPFKMVLRGTKLQLYKIPNDRATAVKDLFPTGFVAVEDELEEEEEEGAKVGGGSAGVTPTDERPSTAQPTRRRRAFWGRGTHPDLVRNSTGIIERGTVEALVHEAAFGTTFSDDGAYRNFARTVLFGLPPASDASKFEAEFIRLCGSYVSGAEDTRAARARVRWLVDEYTSYHGAANDAQAWTDFLAETLPPEPEADPEPSSSVEKREPPSTPDNRASASVSASTRALFADSPILNGESRPNLKLASPVSPPANKLTSSATGLNMPAVPPTPTSPGFGNSPGSSARGALWSSIEREGLTKRALLRLAPAEVAHALRAYHLRVLADAPEKLRVEDVVGTQPIPALQALGGSDASPHWLTKLILLHIFVPDASSGGNGGHGEGSSTSSRTYARAEVLGAWARVGEAARLQGDMCAFRAVYAGLTARPVARLEKTWRRVESGARAIVEGWVEREEGKDVEVKVPWTGDICARVRDAVGEAKTQTGEEAPIYAVVPLMRAREEFETLGNALRACGRGEIEVDAEGEKYAESDARLGVVWEALAKTGGGVGNIASQFIHVDQFMSLSLAAEARRAGQYEPLFWAHASAGAPHPGSAILLPLLFPEHTPQLTLIDRAQLTAAASRGRLDSSGATGAPTSLTMAEVQRVRRPGEARVQQMRRRSMGRDGVATPTEFGGTIIPLFDGELLMLVQPDPTASSRPSSRPPSSRPPSSVETAAAGMLGGVGRTPSIRVRSGHASLDRKPSLARRSSLPSISASARTSLVIPEHPSVLAPPAPEVRVLVQAGTLDRLVDVLAHGLPGVSVGVSDDNGEMPLRERRARDLRLDSAEFARVWWSSFRSFVSPLVFFELLRKRYVAASARVDAAEVAVKRTDVVDVLLAWLHEGGGALDMLNDGALHAAVQAFVRNPPDVVSGSPGPAPTKAAAEAQIILQQRLAAFARAFRAQTLRPTDRAVHVVDVAVLQPSPGSTPQPLTLDKASPEALVNTLDAMALAAMRQVTEEDLLIAADLLEVQSADRLGWLAPWDPPAGQSDDAELQSVYTALRDVPPSGGGHDELFRLFPPALRSALRAHHVLRKWILAQIVAPRLGLHTRAQRMESVIQAIEVARARSEADDTQHVRPGERRVVRSFAEHVLTAAVLAPESRAHARAWVNVAAGRGVVLDTLTSVLVRDVDEADGPPLTTDVGWLLERVLEVLSLPDTFEAVTETGRVINFDKRRHLCNLIVDTQSPTSRRREISRHDLERLSIIEREYGDASLDMRLIRDDAAREAANAPPTRNRGPRPFQRLVTQQLDKNKRDRLLRDRLTRERRAEQARADRRELDQGVPAPRERRGHGLAHHHGPAQQKQRRNKSGSATFFQQLMRPISSALSLDVVSASGEHAYVGRTAAELDFEPSGKPALALNVADARAAAAVRADRSYCFTLDTEDGARFLLQAPSRREMDRWVRVLGQVGRAAAQRRLTYLGSEPKSRIEDHIHDRPAAGARGPDAVFGVPLEALLRREYPSGPPEGAVPVFIERCIQEVERRGMGEVGIYRIAGANSEVNRLREQFNAGMWPVTAETDIYAICDMIKSWFRVLPEPVFPAYSYHDVVNAMKIEEFDARLTRTRIVVHALPRPNFDLLRRIIEHLDRVTDFEEQNQMTPDALAIVFSPNLLRAPDNDFLMIMANMPHTNKLVKTLITNFHSIFDAETADQEDEDEEGEELYLEEPIPEEDEDAVVVLAIAKYYPTTQHTPDLNITYRFIVPHRAALQAVFPSFPLRLVAPTLALVLYGLFFFCLFIACVSMSTASCLYPQHRSCVR